MSVNVLTFWTQVGHMGKILKDAQAFAAATLPAEVATLQSSLGTFYAVAAPLPAALASAQASAVAIAGPMRQAAQSLLCATVAADVALADPNSVTLAMTELLRQMVVAGDTVKACTVTVSVSSSGNTGDGVCVAGVKRGDGLIQQSAMAEVAPLTCTADSQSGGATAGQEPFQYKGDAAQPDPLAWDWPKGSGVTVGLPAVDSLLSANTGGNLLTNSSFETFTVANTPDNWALLVGAAGAQFFSEGTTVYRGTKSLKIVGDGSTLSGIAQTFGSTSGTPAAARPNYTYAVNLWCRVDVVPAAGVLAVELVNASNSVINDDQGAAQTFNVSLPGLTANTWTPLSGVLRLPRVLPSAVKLRVRLSTALSGGTNLFVDDLAAATATFLYAGGPAVKVFAGKTPFVAADAFTLTVANDRAGQSYGATMQTLADRLFGMRSMGLLLPYTSGTPTVPDSLIA